MDLVKIGFLIQTNGLEKANKEVDSLLDKTSKIGTVSKKAAADAETSQKKVKKATDNNTKAVERTTKALEKQKIIGDYLGKGLDKTTATTVANFKQLGASVSETSTMLDTLANNKGILQTRKDIEAANKAQQEHAKLVDQTIGKYRQLSSKSLGGGILDTIEQENKGLQDLRKHYASLEKQQEKNLSIVKEYEAASHQSFGEGILSSIGKQDKALQDLNRQYSTLEKEQSKASKVTSDILSKYENLSRKSIGGGILDSIDQENKGLQELRKQYLELEKQQNKNISVVKEYEAASRKSFGGGILDTVGKQDKGLQDLNAEYRAMEVAQSKLLNAEKQANAERQKTIALEQTKAKYINEGFG